MPDAKDALLQKAANLRRMLAEIDQLTGTTNARAKDAERKRAKRSTEKNVWIPECADRERRLRLEANDEAWLMYYFGPASGVEDPYTYIFTEQQRVMMRSIGHAIKFSGDQALAASRGEGKTTLFERMLIKYTLAGVLTFSVLCAATGSLAENSLDTIRTAFEENELLYQDYPEVCVPVRALENTPSRAHYQTVSGTRFDNGKPFDAVPSRFTWCGQEIILPNVPGSPSAKAIIATRGLDSAVRGLKRKGRRVQLVGIDDPDTEDTARSGEQAIKLEERIDRALGGLGSQTRPVARVMLTTLQSRTCVSYKFTDPAQKPTWKGKRFRFLIQPPERKDLWEEYVQMRAGELFEFAHGRNPDEHCRKSHAFYLAHRDEMDAGHLVANPNRFDATILPDGSQVEVSALQRYYNEVSRTSPEAVATEYDNDPPADDTQAKLLVLSSYHIQNSCLSGLDKRIVPDGTVAITVGGDVQKLGLHYVIVAWSEEAVGCIIDYDFFEFRTEGRKAADSELLILEGLYAWQEAQDSFPFVAESGEEWISDLSLIDAGWKEESWNNQPVQVFCSTLGYGRYLPSKGIPNYRRPRDSTRVIIGDNWHVAFPGGLPLVEMNSDHWKMKVHEGFLADHGEPGSLRLFNPPTIDGRVQKTKHLSYTKHIMSETYESRHKPGFKGTRTGWWKSPKPNHYFDATYQAIVARSMRGINVFERTHAHTNQPQTETVARVQWPPANTSIGTRERYY